VCIDDVWGKQLAEQISVPTQTVSLADTQSTWLATRISSGAGKTSFEIEYAGHPKAKCSINLLGDFNVANALEALVVCQQLGFELESLLASALHTRPVPGRLEIVALDATSYAVVDYAHTPDAVEKVLTQLRKQSPERIITVIGCGGDRDSLKRPQMGRMAGELSDVVIVTDDNPRSEVPAEIRAAVLAGVIQTTALEIADRREAIREALNIAGPGDIVAVLGKGHEVGQEINGVVHPFNDVTVIREESQRA